MGSCLSIICEYFTQEDDAVYKPLDSTSDNNDPSPLSSPRTLGSPYSNMSDNSENFNDIGDDNEIVLNNI